MAIDAAVLSVAERLTLLRAAKRDRILAAMPVDASGSYRWTPVDRPDVLNVIVALEVLRRIADDETASETARIEAAATVLGYGLPLSIGERP